MMHHLLGIATATPPLTIAQQDSAELAASVLPVSPSHHRSLAALYRTTRIRTRGSVLLEPPHGEGYRQSFFQPATSADDAGPSTRDRLARYEAEAPALAEAVATRALKQAAVPAAEVSHLVTCSCTGFSNPGVDLALIQRLGLSTHISRTHVGFMGCHGGFNALRVASALAAADPSAVVLTTAVELCSLHFQYSDRGDQLVANAIFADGAAAVVGTSQPQPATDWGSGWILRHQASVVLPDSGDCMAWTIGDNGFVMQLSPRVPQVIASHLGPFVDATLARLGMQRRDIRSWAVHPGGPRVLTCVEEALGLPDASLQVSRSVLADHGNMSSATIFFILERLRQQAAPLPCVALAFGPGLTCELAVFTEEGQATG